MSAALIRSDATAIPLGDETVDAIITSPPYFALKWRIWHSGQAARVAAKTDGERQGDVFGATA